jgi:hypothetical protein
MTFIKTVLFEIADADLHHADLVGGFDPALPIDKMRR